MSQVLCVCSMSRVCMYVCVEYVAAVCVAYVTAVCVPYVSGVCVAYVSGVCVCVAEVTLCLWRSEDSLQGSVLSLNCLRTRAQIWLSGLVTNTFSC